MPNDTAPGSECNPHLGTVDGPTSATVVGRRRPIGLSAGAGVLIGSWFVAGAIARLTGAPSVIALMAAFLIAVATDALSGWSAVTRPAVRSVMGPSAVEVGTDARLVIGLERLPRRRSRRPRLTIVAADEEVGTAEIIEEPAADSSPVMIALGRFPRAGVVRDLRVDVAVVGVFGLLWWRRRTQLATEPIHVSPPPSPPILDVDRTVAVRDGAVAAARGTHLGDVDGVRPWREGEPVGAVHWPSALRAGSLIVHDRAAASEEQWIVDLDVVTDTPDAAGRLRWTLDEGLRRGHAVSIVADGTWHEVASDDDAARWAATVAQRATVDRESGRSLLRRPVRLRRPSVEVLTTLEPRARWAAAVAAFCALSTLVGALGWSAILIAMLAGATALGAAVSSYIARREGRRPIMLQVAIVVAIVGALVAIALDARDVDGLLSALRGPMPNLLMLLVVLHGFEVVDRRTLRVHQAITFVVAAYAAGLRIDDALGWWLGAWGIAFLSSLWLTPRRPGLSPRARHHRRVLFASTTVLGPVLWTCGATLATLALLSVVPIPDGPARLGLPALSNDAPTAAPGTLVGPDGSPPSISDPAGGSRGAIGDVVGYPGFTETLDTSLRGDLGDSIVMRVRAPEPAFWRGQTFADFDGRTWSVSDARGERRDGPVIEVDPTLGDAVGSDVPSEELVQTYYVETDLPNLVFAASRPTRVIFDGALWTRPDGALRSDVTLAEGSVYTVVSDRVQVTPDALRAQGDLGPLFDGFRDVAGGSRLDRFLALPDSTSQRTIDLATRLRTPGEPTYDTILAYEGWLAANTEYDLDAPIPDEGADAVDDFLFESRLGFCEQIASTLAVMLRSQGVPARLATGYVAGERDRVSGVWNVKASDAHAWVEVWFPQTGWQPFDPTASVPLAGETNTGTVGGELVGAAVTSIASHRLELGAVALGAAACWAAAMSLRSLRRRRRRGRWGLLQDRFSALGDARARRSAERDGLATPLQNAGSSAGEPTPSGPATNRTIAAALRTRTDAARSSEIDLVADTLDRVAFDPTWVDDDEVYTRSRATVSTLERATR